MPSRRRKILLVYPKFPMSFWSFGYIQHIGGFKAIMPPLGLAILGALTPPDYDVEIVDENVEADRLRRGVRSGRAVRDGDSGGAAVRNRRYVPAARQAGVHGRPDLQCPAGALPPHCDVLFEGEGEYTWPRFLAEWSGNAHRDHYVQTEMIDMRDSPAPRLELLKLNRYRVGVRADHAGLPVQVRVLRHHRHLRPQGAGEARGGGRARARTMGPPRHGFRDGGG